jgi:hypothetical protein
MPQRPDSYRLFQQAQKLALPDLEQLVAQLAAEVEARQATESADRSQTWREEYRKCGKPNCRCANTDYRHGPYWYRSVWSDGVVKKEYRRSQAGG